ncbi:MAG TPA: transglycosylase SLT domain-containing protein, partial [Spirochaetota bacterium]|nr:transglycosylase SLT domain-containing protein [Spirochaetota bacterium]
MKKVFKEADIPEELAYLPLIESGFVNFARSNKGATGMWQFMPGTAKWMGMKMDSFIDERKDPIIACKFAAKFLNFLYEKLGDWHLVLAAYNHGGRNIINELKKTKTNYFYDLVKAKTTPKETRDYVPRFVASVMIIKDLEKYSFSSIDESSDYEYYKFPFSAPAFVIAKRSNLKVEEFLRLNPALRDGYVPDPKYNYFVRLPKKNLDILLENYEELKKDASLCYVPYYIKQGDTLSEIALRYGISTAFLLKINRVTNANRLFPGQKIYIPLRGYQLAKKK